MKAKDEEMKQDNPHAKHRQRLRERFLSTGLEGFQDHEILELALFYVYSRRDTNPIGHALIERFGSLSGVLDAPVEALSLIHISALMKSGDAGSDSLNYIFIQFIFSNTSWYRSIAPDNVTSASLNMYSNNSGAAGKISQGIPTGTWNYQSITWNNRPGMNSDGSYNGVTPPAPSSIHANTGWQTIYITDFIRGSLRNYVHTSLYRTVHELRGLRLWVNRPQFRQYRSSSSSSMRVMASSILSLEVT